MNIFKALTIGLKLMSAFKEIIKDGKITLNDVPIVLFTIAEAFGLSADKELYDLTKYLQMVEEAKSQLP